MATKAKVYNYYKSLSFIYNGTKQTLLTQLYQIGVYGIWNNNPAEQGSYSPNQMVSLVRKLKKGLEAGEITELDFGRPIRVTTDDKGFWVEQS